VFALHTGHQRRGLTEGNRQTVRLADTTGLMRTFQPK